jgi:HSP20 family molecular chaperone IbpA
MRSIPVRIGTTILDEIEKVYDDITQKASELFLDRLNAGPLDIDDWLTVEKQVLWKPDVEITERQSLFIVRTALDPIDAASVEILVTPSDVLIQSRVKSRQPRIFRAVHFGFPINPLQMHATYVEGTLILIAPKLSVRNNDRRLRIVR